MDVARTLRLDNLPTSFLNHLDGRDAAIWACEPFVIEAGGLAVAELLRLPWQRVLTESSDPTLLAALERSEDASDPLVRRKSLNMMRTTSASTGSMARRYVNVVWSRFVSFRSALDLEPGWVRPNVVKIDVAQQDADRQRGISYEPRIPRMKHEFVEPDGR